MTVPALNPEITSEERKSFRKSSEPRYFAKLDLLLSVEGAFDTYITLLRDPDSEDVRNAQRDKELFLNLPELDAVGLAKLIACNEVSYVQQDGGSLVTGTFRHLADNYFETSFDNGEVFRVTGSHPIWSGNRQAFVAVRDLRIGDQAQLADGSTTQVVSNERQVESLEVFNIEVENEHVYYVGSDGLLVHNQYPEEGAADAAGDATKHESVIDGGTGPVKSYSGSRKNRMGDPEEAARRARRDSAYGKPAPPNAYEVAEQGGRHAGYLRNRLGQSPESLIKEAQTLRMGAAEHEDKILKRVGYNKIHDDPAIQARAERTRPRHLEDEARGFLEQAQIAEELARRKTQGDL